MIGQAGTSVSLSLLIVTIAAVALHRPEGAKSPGTKAASQPRTEASPQRLPAPTPSIAWTDAPAAAAPPVIPPKKAEPSRSPPRRPKSSSTRVRDGESLADVAARVYGPGIDLRAFWKVNRDQVEAIDAPVRPGMLLRTPDL